MNHAIVAKPRNGKGRYAVGLIADELRTSKRRVITNLAVKKFPWATKDHRLRRGYIDYLSAEFKKDFNVTERMFVLTDEAIAHYFLYRGLSEEEFNDCTEKQKLTFRLVTQEDNALVEWELEYHKDIKLYIANHAFHLDKRGKKVVDTYDSTLSTLSGGHMYIIDEAWAFWPARGWSNTSEAVNFHFAQVGKFTDDNWLITHRVNDCDSVLMDRCQDFHVCTNHGKMTFSIFRQPTIFSVSIYFQKPTPSAEPHSKKLYKLDKHGLCECFDTSGGVGVGGLVGADVGVGAKGLPVWLIPLAGIALICLLIFGYEKMAGFIHSRLSAKKAVQKLAVTTTNLPPVMPASARGSDRGALELEEPPLVCTGFAGFGTEFTAWLSDGSEWTTGDGLTKVTGHGVTINGKFYKMARHAPSNYVAPPLPSAVAVQPDGIAVADRPVNQAFILPSIHGIEPGGVQTINGLNSMKRSSQVSQNFSAQNQE